MDVVEVVLSWGATVLAVEHVRAGRRLAIGERGDLVVPAEIIGADRVEIVRHDSAAAIVSAPPGARLRINGRHSDEARIEMRRGEVVELAFGPLVVKMTLASSAERIGGVGFAELRGSGAGCMAGSALFHGAVFVAIALFAPSLGATEEDPFDADRLALLQRMLDASAEREHDHPPAESAAAGGGDSNGGQSAARADGAAGKAEARTMGRWAAKGDARPENATLAREHALRDAQDFAAIRILSSMFASDPNAPVVPWGSTLNGSDDVSKVGRLFGRSIDDATGTGLGAFGFEPGGGGTSHTIGLDALTALGHAGTCMGDDGCPGAIGRGRGRIPGSHPSRFKGPRYATPAVNGRLAPEVIQRVVRLNDGRYRFCYESALRRDPGLQGRVTVKFMIDRTGAVGVVADGGSDIPDEAVRRCVISSFLSLSFPAPESGAVSVVYPIVFNPE